MPRKGKAKKTGAQPKPKQRKPVTQRPIREVGAAPLKLVGASGQATEFSRIADGVPVVVHPKGTRVLADPLEFYLHRNNIDSDQYSAGNSLRVQHYRAFGSGYHAVNLDGFHGTTNYADNWRISTSQGEAMVELKRTLEMFTPAQSRMLVEVCCHGVYAKYAAKGCGVHWRRGIRLLREALTLLSAYYRTGRRPNMNEAPGGKPGA